MAVLGDFRLVFGGLGDDRREKKAIEVLLGAIWNERGGTWLKVPLFMGHRGGSMPC